MLGGIALAFLLELYLDPTLKRPIEVETRLHLPLFLSIPDAGQNGFRLPFSGRNGQAQLTTFCKPDGRGDKWQTAGTKASCRGAATMNCNRISKRCATA